MSAAEIAKALGGHPSGGGYLVRCPLPSHGQGRGDRRPSLSVSDGDDGRLLVRCFAGCDPLDVLAELRRLSLDEKPDTDRWGNRIVPTKFVGTNGNGANGFHDIGRKTYDVVRNQTDEIRQFGSRDIRRIPSDVEPDAAALALWRAAVPIAGTLAEQYLVEHRKLRPPFPPTLRFGHAPYRHIARTLPALLAAVQAPDRRVIALQATFINAATAAKANVSTARWTFGKLGTGCVRLAAAGPVLGIAEGTETALASTQLSGLPCWAVLGSERLASVYLPPEAVEVHIFADNDVAGRRGAEKAAERFTSEGRRVLVRSPADGYGDWADVVADLAREDAA
jgi:putative DNA primase/helicase